SGAPAGGAGGVTSMTGASVWAGGGGGPSGGVWAMARPVSARNAAPARRTLFIGSSFRFGCPPKPGGVQSCQANDQTPGAAESVAAGTPCSIKIGRDRGVHDAERRPDIAVVAIDGQGTGQMEHLTAVFD